MKFVFLTLAIGAVFSCSVPYKESHLFEEFASNEQVTIYLSSYKLDSVPADIGYLKHVQRLYITRDSLGWTMYPQLGPMPHLVSSIQGHRLPDEICRLRDLKYLGLVKLDLITLPDNFGKLKDLDSLDISMNRLVISNELTKLKQLRKLRYLELVGNWVRESDIEQLKEANPQLVIHWQFEH